MQRCVVGPAEDNIFRPTPALFEQDAVVDSDKNPMLNFKITKFSIPDILKKYIMSLKK